MLAAMIAAVPLSLLHLAAGHIKALDVVPRSWVLSAGSGVSIAYVFIHLLPELAEIQEHLAESLTGGWLSYLETHAWLVAMLGLAMFYGLELAARRRRGADAQSPATHSSDRVGWIHIASYALYNGVIGYLLHDRAEASTLTLVLFAAAMGIHFLVNDHGLRAHHGALYHDVGRWVVSGGVLAGWLVGATVELTEAALGLMIAFLGGGVIMNVLKEELPEGRESSWVPFLGGAVGYALLLFV